jgi:hypothetical protein
VVCRIFQKSAVKKPQQAPSSQLSLDESPCDTNSIAKEFRDIELPNLNSVNANSSTAFCNINISPQSYNNIISDNNNNNKANMINLNNSINNWGAPSLSWPASLLSSGLSMNSLLLKALQLRSYQQPREATEYSSYMPTQGFSHNFGNDHLTASSSKVLESAQQQQQPEQPFNMDSIW